jgi:hypothetical protein
MNPGIYDNITNEQYHASEGISSTGISLILDCPKRYYYEYHEKGKKDENDSFDFGTAVHMLVLEPQKFNDTYFLMHESVDLRTKAGKEAMELAEKSSNGRKILRKGVWEEAKIAAEYALKHSFWSKLTNPKIEHSIYWEGGIYNTLLKSRPDAFNDSLIVDFKTTDSIKGFSNSIYNFGYHRQAAMQVDALYQLDGKKRFFAYFVIEKKAPYLTALFTLDEVSLEQGRREYLDGAALYSECEKSNNWPGYEEKFQLISIPKWAIKTEDGQ